MSERLQSLGRWMMRLSVFGVATWLFTSTLNRSVARSAELKMQAGFWDGVAHGAMMPIALPSLAMGKDVAIFSAHHDGRRYKLGYTLGVNACGALFFGLLYRKLSKWKAQASSSR